MYRLSRPSSGCPERSGGNGLVRAAALGLGVVLSLAGCSQGTDAASGTAPNEQATTSAAVVHNDADTEFAQMMIVHHQGALEMAEFAVAKAATPQVKALAERITAAQQPEIDLMTGWLKAWGEPLSAGMDHSGMDHSGMDMGGMDQEQVMTELEGLDGTDFDKRFLTAMTAHHEGAIEMAQAQEKDGLNEEAVTLAGQIIDAQTQEIGEMEAITGAIG